ncbi:unnamed protein product [Calypogeia fissa]
MASLLHVLPSSTPQSTHFQPVELQIPFFSSSGTIAANSSTAKFTRKRKNANSSIISAASQHEGNSAREAAQLSVDSKDGRTLTKKLGGIVCGVCTATSIIAWDLLPAFADELPPPPDVSSIATPYAKSADRLKMGLVKGRIQPCPLDVNPNCVSTSSNNGGYSAPWIIPESSTANAAKKIETAILSTQKNPAILKVEEVPGGGTYLAAEADGFLGRDVMEFLIKEDVVTYRSMARKVVYLYPFTTPIGDFDGQQRRLKALEEELGWSIPSFENTYYDPTKIEQYDY